MYSAIVHGTVKQSVLYAFTQIFTSASASSGHTESYSARNTVGFGSTTEGYTDTSLGYGATWKRTSAFSVGDGFAAYTVSVREDVTHAPPNGHLDVHSGTPASDAMWTNTVERTYQTTVASVVYGTSSDTVGETISSDATYTYVGLSSSIEPGSQTPKVTSYATTVLTANGTSMASRAKGLYITRRVATGVSPDGRSALYSTEQSVTSDSESFPAYVTSSFNSTIRTDEQLLENTALIVDNDHEGFFIAKTKRGQGRLKDLCLYINRNHIMSREGYLSTVSYQRAVGGLAGSTAPSSTAELSFDSTHTRTLFLSSLQGARQRLVYQTAIASGTGTSYVSDYTQSTSGTTTSEVEQYYARRQNTQFSLQTRVGRWIGMVITDGAMRVTSDDSAMGKTITPFVYASTVGTFIDSSLLTLTVVDINDPGVYLPLGSTTDSAASTSSNGGESFSVKSASFSPPLLYGGVNRGLVLSPRGAQGFAPFGEAGSNGIIYRDIGISFVSADFNTEKISFGIPAWLYSARGTTGSVIPISQAGWSSGGLANVTAFLTDQQFVMPALSSYERTRTQYSSAASATVTVTDIRASTIAYVTGGFLTSEDYNKSQRDATIAGITMSRTSKNEGKTVSYTELATARIRIALGKAASPNDLTGWTSEYSGDVPSVKGGHGYGTSGVQLVSPGLYWQTVLSGGSSYSGSVMVQSESIGSITGEKLIAEKREPIYTAGFGSSLFPEYYQS